jgi:hypothetical protein
VFLTAMVIGLVGLVMMAVPALGGRHHLSHVRAGGHAPSLAHHGGHVDALVRGGALKPYLVLRFLPSPRALFSVSALYGAIGNALVHAVHLGRGTSALVAIPPALLIEGLLVRPIWNLLFRFQGEPSGPLEALILGEAQAVVPFRNGRGIVSTIREGRRVQLSARLRPEEAGQPVAVGQLLRIEDVDARRECVTVSVLSNPNPSPRPT